MNPACEVPFAIEALMWSLTFCVVVFTILGAITVIKGMN